MKRKKIIGFYDYTVILTYLGMVISFAGIILVMNEAYVNAVICLMFAGVCDMFDGAVASTKKRDSYEKHFGIQIDSLCDLISFGVLPAVFVYVITGKSVVIGILVSVYTLCGLIRLAYFNVQEYERQKASDEKREVYLGIPITTSAILIPLGYLLYTRFSKIDLWIFPLLIFVLATGFITGIEIKKPNLIQKVIVIIVGIIELAGVFVLNGADVL